MRRGVVVVVVCAAACSSGDPTLRIERVGTSAEGSVTSPVGLDCGDDCSVSVPAGAIVPIEIVVPRGVRYMGLVGGGCPAAALTCEVTVPEEGVTITVTFDQKREIVDIPTTGNPDLDILVVNDNSGGTQEEQNALAVAFPVLLDMLDDVEGGLPSVHVGVVTSDMGAMGMLAQDPACAESDGGRLIKGNPDLADQCPEVAGSFLTNTNVTGSYATAFACMIRGSDGGCGFEQPLEAMRAALDDHPDNVGFLRPTASLGVLVLMDEDDCSTLEPDFFGPESAELGPIDSFRCFEQSVRCAEGTGSALRAEGPKTDCVVDESSPYMTGIATRYVDFLRGLKANRRSIAVGLIAGEPAPVAVGRRTPTGSTVARPDLIPSCSYTDGNGATNTADPGIRLHAFVEPFGTRGVESSVCLQDYAPAVSDFARILRSMVGYPCIDGRLYEIDACDLAFVVQPGTPAAISLPLEVCTPALDNRPCWHAVAGDAVCGSKRRIVVEHDEAPPADSAVIGSCRVD